MADFLIDSLNIDIYPTTKRSTTFDNKNKSKLNFEPNISGIVSSVTDYSSYIVDGLELQVDSEHTGKFILTAGNCVINGYNIQIKQNISNISIDSDNYLYMYITKDDNGLTGSDNNDTYSSVIIDALSQAKIGDNNYLLIAYIDTNSNINNIKSGKYNLDKISFIETSDSISENYNKDLFTNWLLNDGFIVNDGEINKLEENNKVVIIYKDGTYLKLDSNKTELLKSDLINKDDILSLYIPITIFSLEEHLLEGCTSLQYLTLPFIGTSASNKCTLQDMFNVDPTRIDVKNIKILSTKYLPSGKIYDSIYQNTFRHCSNIEKVFLPDSILSIQAHAFDDASSISEISIPKSVTSIGYRAFKNCTSLRKIYINSIITYDIDAFYNVNLNSTLSNDNGLYINNIDTLIKSTYLVRTSNPIYNGSYVYINGTRIQSLNLNDYKSDSLLDYCCAGLYINDLILGKNITKIGKDSFFNSTVRNVTWNYDSNIESNNYKIQLSDSSFKNCTNLDSFIFNSDSDIKRVSCYKIDKEAFSGCTRLSNLILPGIVYESTLGDLVFNGCSSLKYVYLNLLEDYKRLPILLENSSGNKTSFDNTECYIYFSDVPSTSYGNWKYFWSKYINRIVIDPCLIEYNQESYYISVTGTLNRELIDSAISQVINEDLSPTSLTSFTFNLGQSAETDASINYIGDESFSSYTGLRSITFGLKSSILSIGENAFSNTSLQGEIVLPNSLIEIKYGAFFSCQGLTKINIPANVSIIGGTAFESCSNLTSVDFVNTNDWVYESSNTYTVFDGSSAEYTLTPERAALYLRDTYSSYDWNLKTISYLLNFIDGTNIVETRTVYNNVAICYNNLSLPTLPEREHYIFDGWYINDVKLTQSTVYNYTTNNDATSRWTLQN